MIQCLYNDYILISYYLLHLVFRLNFLFHRNETILMIFSKVEYSRIPFKTTQLNQIAWKLGCDLMKKKLTRINNKKFNMLSLSMLSRWSILSNCFISVKQKQAPKNQVYKVWSICHNMDNMHCILIGIVCFIVFMIYYE